MNASVCVWVRITILSVPLIGLRHKTQWEEANLRVGRFWVSNTFPRPYLNFKPISLVVKSKRFFLERTLYIWFLNDNALKHIPVIYLCGHYLLITMLNLYNWVMIWISPYYLSLHNFLNKMSFIACNFLLSRNHVKKMSLQEFVREWRPN